MMYLQFGLIFGLCSCGLIAGSQINAHDRANVAMSAAIHWSKEQRGWPI